MDDAHLERMRAALRSGREFPPIVVDEKNRIIDGFHRRAMFEAERGIDFLVEVIVKKYSNDAAAIIDASRLNATHGKPLTVHDRTALIARCAKLKASMRALAAALGMKWSEFKAIANGQVATVQHVYPQPRVRDVVDVVVEPAKRIIIKKTIAHMSGKDLTPKQVQANERLNGWQQSVYVDQMLILLESGLLNTDDESLMTKVRKMHSLLSDLFARGATNGKTPEALATSRA